jgi:hypothetical protein
VKELVVRHYLILEPVGGRGRCEGAGDEAPSILTRPMEREGDGHGVDCGQAVALLMKEEKGVKKVVVKQYPISWSCLGGGEWRGGDGG